MECVIRIVLRFVTLMIVIIKSDLMKILIKICLMIDLTTVL